MERRDDEPSLANEHRPAVVIGQHLDLGPGLADPRRPDEDAPQWPSLSRELEISLEARDLATVRVSVNLEVDEPEVVAVEDDHPGARTQDRLLERPDRLVEAVQTHQ